MTTTQFKVSFLCIFTAFALFGAGMQFERWHVWKDIDGLKARRGCLPLEERHE